MSKQSILLNSVLSLVLAGASIGGFFYLGSGKAPVRKKPPKAPGVAVKTVPIEVHSGPIMLQAHGVVVPYREIRLAAEVRGRVIEQSDKLRSGGRVTEGEVLLRIDPTNYQLEVRRLQAQLAQNHAELEALQVSVENNNQLLKLAQDEHALRLLELKRIEGLVATGAATQSDIEETRRAEITTRGAMLLIENRLRDLGSERKLLAEKLNLTAIQLEGAKLDEQRSVIYSPVSGIVVQSNVEEQGFVEAGQPFATIEDSSTMEVRCNLTSEEMTRIWQNGESASGGSEAEYFQGIPAVVSYKAGQKEYQWQADFDRIAGAGIDERTRTTPCLFRVEHPESVNLLGSESEPNIVGPDSLMRGMFVSVSISCRPDGELFRVPASSIRPGKKIWLAKQERMSIEAVKVVSRSLESAIVESPRLAAGQKVIVSPVAGAREGLPIQTGPPKGKPGNKTAAERPTPKRESTSGRNSGTGAETMVALDKPVYPSAGGAQLKDQP